MSKTLSIQVNKVKDSDVYRWTISTAEVIERAVFVELTFEEIRELYHEVFNMLNSQND